MMDQRMQIKQTNRVAASVQLMISLILNMVLLFNTHFLYSLRTGCLPIAMQKYGLWLEYMPRKGFFGPTCCDTPPRLRQMGRMPPEIVATTFPMRPENGY